MVSDPSEKGWNEDLCHPFVVILYTFYSKWIQKSLGLKNICIWHLVIGWRNMTFLSWILVVQFRPLFTRPRFFFFLIIFIVTLVCMGCHKYYRLQSLDNRHLFSRSPAGWYPRSRWLLGWFLVNPLFLPCVGHLLTLSLHGLSSVHLCKRKLFAPSTSYKDASSIRLGTTLMISRSTSYFSPLSKPGYKM